jgi:hypothetical protein
MNQQLQLLQNKVLEIESHIIYIPCTHETLTNPYFTPN